MSEWFHLNQSTLRLSGFIAIFILMAIWEWQSPSRQLQLSKYQRWLNHGALIVISSLAIRWLTPFALTGLAFYAQQQHIGLLVWLNVPLWIAIVSSLLLMDGLVYGQHRLMHSIPILWRLHRLHHSDMDFDITTGVRFHPIEMMLSFFVKAAIIIALGVPVIAVVVFELLLSSLALFNHANINLPKRIESITRLFIVTPDVHRIHHSTINSETNSNYGFNLIMWDRLFGSYTETSRYGDEHIEIGLNEFKQKQLVTQLHHLLWQPFKQ